MSDKLKDFLEIGEAEMRHQEKVFLNYIQINTEKVKYLIDNVKNSKELYELAQNEYENKVMSVYKGKSILYSKYGLCFRDMLTPIVYGPISAIFDSPVGSFILICEDMAEWDRDEEITSKRHAYEFFRNHEIKHVIDYQNPIRRYFMKKAYVDLGDGRANHKAILKYELRADKYALNELKKSLPTKVVVRTLMCVYKFLNININQLNENIRAHREFALKFLSPGILTRPVFESIIKRQTDNRFLQSEEVLDSIEKRLKVFENEIKEMNPLGTITMDF